MKAKNKKRVLKNKKEILIVGLIILIILVAFIVTERLKSNGSSIFSENKGATGNSPTLQQVQIVQLSNDEINKVGSILMSSEFMRDVPEKNPIALRFFKFENGQRVWQTGFLIGKNQLLSEGEPTIYLTLHSKYISELNTENLCQTIKKANQNGDLGFESKYNKAILLLKYAKMLKHRGCFGF